MNRVINSNAEKNQRGFSAQEIISYLIHSSQYLNIQIYLCMYLLWIQHAVTNKYKENVCHTASQSFAQSNIFQCIPPLSLQPSKTFESISSKLGRSTFMLLQQSIHGKPADYIDCLSLAKGDFPKSFVFGQSISAPGQLTSLCSTNLSVLHYEDPLLSSLLDLRAV